MSGSLKSRSHAGSRARRARRVPRVLRIVLNDVQTELPEGTTIAGLTELLWHGAGLWSELVVVDWSAVDAREWTEIALRDGARVEICGSDRRPLG
jgi:sulfur carrier protein ThiS